MAQKYRTIVSFDPDVLFQTDTYLAEQRRNGKPTDRSALVNAALLFYLQAMREREAARENPAPVSELCWK